MDEMIDMKLDVLLSQIPEYVANKSLPDPKLLRHYNDEVNRVYWIDTGIDDSTLELIKFILRCNKEDSGKLVEERKRILVMIDSPGGSVEVEQSIIGAMKNSKTPVWTCCYCTAYSAAADILACGQKRFAMPYVNIMFHAGSGKYEGTQAQIDSAKKFFDKMNDRVNKEVLSRVKFSPKIVKKLKTEDIYLNEEEALELGIVDKIITDFDEIV